MIVMISLFLCTKEIAATLHTVWRKCTYGREHISFIISENILHSILVILYSTQGNHHHHRHHHEKLIGFIIVIAGYYQSHCHLQGKQLKYLLVQQFSHSFALGFANLIPKIRNKSVFEHVFCCSCCFSHGFQWDSLWSQKTERKNVFYFLILFNAISFNEEQTVKHKGLKSI